MYHAKQFVTAGYGFFVSGDAIHRIVCLYTLIVKIIISDCVHSIKKKIYIVITITELKTYIQVTAIDRIST